MSRASAWEKVVVEEAPIAAIIVRVKNHRPAQVVAMTIAAIIVRRHRRLVMMIAITMIAAVGRPHMIGIIATMPPLVAAVLHPTTMIAITIGRRHAIPHRPRIVAAVVRVRLLRAIRRRATIAATTMTTATSLVVVTMAEPAVPTCAIVTEDIVDSLIGESMCALSCNAL
jgi:hypothetical protein